MLFFIRFRGQLRRTKPALVSSLESAVAEAAAAAGAVPENERKLLGAFFNEDRIGFWLDILVFLEKVKEVLEKAAPGLYGYALTLGRDIPEISGRELCRSLSGEQRRKGTGIWCSDEAARSLEPYLEFGLPQYTEGDAGQNTYREILTWKSFDGGQEEYPCREKTQEPPGLPAKNTVFTETDFNELKDSLYQYGANLPEHIPPLAVRFGAGGRGLVCFADAYTPLIRSFIAAAADAVPKGTPENLDAASARLFRERLRDEWSPSLLGMGRAFIRSLLAAYTAAAKIRASRGILLLEGLSLADAGTVSVFRDAHSALEDKDGLLILAADNAPEDSIKSWGDLFSQMPDSRREDEPERPFPHSGRNRRRELKREKDIPRDLWETAYLYFLLRRYFPVYLLPRLIEEEGLNRDMYFRSLGILSARGLVSGDDPRPLLEDFVFRAEKALGERKEKIRSVVRSRLLAWAGSGKVSPCFNLLRILSELGGGADDALVLKSLKADVLNGTWEGIEEALNKGYFSSLAGDNAALLSYIYKTLKVLVWGNGDEIRRGFEDTLPYQAPESGKPHYPLCQAQAGTNLAAFYIGSRNFDAASEELRKVMLLNRDLGKNAVPAHRLFSLVNLARQRIDDALEYSSFALEQAERTEQREELVLSSYFASSINLLYGNLSRALRLAAKAEETASALGQSSWAARAAFLRGRLNFETGRYGDALEIFGSLDKARGAASLPEPPGMAATLAAWIKRTEIFSGRTSPRKHDTANPGYDERIFEIEAAYFAGDYEKTASLAGDFLSPLREGIPESSGDNFLFTEQPDWSSGFAQCEYMFRPGQNAGTKMAWVYRAMAQCGLHPSREVNAGILSGMQRFMRDESLPDTDPNDSFYFYAWHTMLRKTGAAQVDMNTVVSMAFKRLQRRAGRIDDTEIKQAFLSLSHWNKPLILAAREHKLIV